MKKLYSISADWRQKDVSFLNTLKISRKVEEGICIFSIEEGKDYDKFIDFYSKQDSLFKKTKPKEFRMQLASCIFTEKELDAAKHYALAGIFQGENGYPEPEQGLVYQDIIFKYDSKEFGVNKTQIAPFSVKKPKWKKNS